MAKEFFVLPVISRKDYNAFRRDVGPNLAESYDEWSNQFAGELSAAERRGDTIVDVEVRYGDFIAYCHTHGINPDPKVLLAFSLVKKAELRDKLA
jgi:hypothetical protein